MQLHEEDMLWGVVLGVTAFQVYGYINPPPSKKKTKKA